MLIKLIFKKLLVFRILNFFFYCFFSSWSGEGCRVAMYNITHTVCSCDHLTNFAVLMDVHATPISDGHKTALAAITYVGCAISIVCFFVTIIVFQASKGLKVRAFNIWVIILCNINGIYFSCSIFLTCINYKLVLK